MPSDSKFQLSVWHLAGFIIGGTFLLSCVGCCGGFGGGFHYSDGYRDGHIQKFSNKGMIWKTWEGELALPGFKQTGVGENAAISNVFEFTVLDQDVRNQITQLNATDFVRLHYEQYVWSPPWNGYTGYRIVRVEKLKENK